MRFSIIKTLVCSFKLFAYYYEIILPDPVLTKTVANQNYGLYFTSMSDTIPRNNKTIKNNKKSPYCDLAWFPTSHRF